MFYRWPAAGVCLIFLTAALTGCGSETDTQSTAAAPPAISVEVLVAQPELLEHNISVTGSVLANEEVELRSETSGRLVELNFEEGTVVQKGALLAKINDRDLQAQYRQLILQDSLLNREVYRLQELLKINAISTEEYERGETELASLRAEQEVLQTSIERTDIRAPFTGRVGLRYVSEGALVQPATLIATLQQIDPIKIEFAVPEKYRSFLKEGTDVQFTVTGIDSVFAAKVYAVEARIDRTTRSITARARCSNSAGLLFPGAFASMEIILEEVEDAILIPSEAISPEIDGHNVFVISNGLAHEVAVETGVRSERRTQIISGISPGDTIATTGLLQLQDSAVVVIQ